MTARNALRLAGAMMAAVHIVEAVAVASLIAWAARG